MGLFLRQDGGRSELQTKVASDLRERLKERAAIPQDEHEPTMTEDQHETRPAGLIIIVLIIALVLMGVVMFLYTNGAF